MNAGGQGRASSVSCGLAGRCAAGGFCADGIVPPRPWGHFHGPRRATAPPAGACAGRSGHDQGFVVTQAR